MDCERVIHEPTCWHHPELRLLDPTDPTTIDSLRALDDRDRAQAYTQIMRKLGLMTAASLVVWLIAVVMFGPQPSTMYPLAIAAPLAVLLPRWARRKAYAEFRPRFGRWTGEDSYPELSEEELAAIEPYDEDVEPSLLSSLR